MHSAQIARRYFDMHMQFLLLPALECHASGRSPRPKCREKAAMVELLGR